MNRDFFRETKPRCRRPLPSAMSDPLSVIGRGGGVQEAVAAGGRRGRAPPAAHHHGTITHSPHDLNNATLFGASLLATFFLNFTYVPMGSGIPHSLRNP
ncbi:hypothetical protein Pmani_019717 [Petrolisthes manimaculis]|uniref:Uncharacterized protein n=1 Tax=Petrolisthes manimaculis TaxID=1843537 RepID=A0AAE1U435_9EUCA|nr:hypothetical protein Pmani_022687 [Petrolisthes manimaculis]KAK4308608.1 hypothetical protein Pmani_019717 [Petrolisthes manimaculis]